MHDPAMQEGCGQKPPGLGEPQARIEQKLLYQAGSQPGSHIDNPAGNDESVDYIDALLRVRHLSRCFLLPPLNWRKPQLIR